MIPDVVYKHLGGHYGISVRDHWNKVGLLGQSVCHYEDRIKPIRLQQLSDGVACDGLPRCFRDFIRLQRSNWFLQKDLFHAQVSHPSTYLSTNTNIPGATSSSNSPAHKSSIFRDAQQVPNSDVALRFLGES